MKDGRGGFTGKAARMLAVLLSVVLSVTLFGGCGGSATNSLENAPKSVSSLTELKKVLKDYNSYLNISASGGFWGSRTVDDSLDMAESAPQANGAESDYSGTNTQVEDIDEGDIVKNDGSYIYKLQNSGLNIYSVQSGTINVVSKTAFDDFSPYEMYLYSRGGTESDTAVMLGCSYSLASRSTNEIAPLCECYYYSPETMIKIYDISDKANPELLRELTISGYYNTSRITDGRLYYIINYYFYYDGGDVFSTGVAEKGARGAENSLIPKISDSADGGEYKDMPFSEIYCYTSVPSYSYFIVGYIDLNDTTVSVRRAYLGVSGETYFAGESFYAVSSDYSMRYTRNLFGYRYASSYKSMSRIIKFSAESLSHLAIARVDGTIANRYYLDEYQGNLRMAVTVYEYGENQSRMYSNVYVLDSELKEMGRISDIAEGERIYSVRFKNEQCSLVTFRNIDPYFNIDLSDPYNPVIAGELKEEGVSEYLHYIGDSGYTIGVGRDAVTIQSEWGEWVQFAGIKVALYDVSGLNPTAVVTDNFSLNSRLGNMSAYTELSYNPKALLYSLQRGLFAFPVELWSYSSNYYTTSMRQGLAVFYFDTETETLEFRGLLTDYATDVSTNDYYNYYENYNRQIRRGIQIGDYIYTVSDKFVTSYSLTDLTQTDKVNAY